MLDYTGSVINHNNSNSLVIVGSKMTILRNEITLSLIKLCRSTSPMFWPHCLGFLRNMTLRLDKTQHKYILVYRIFFLHSNIYIHIWYANCCIFHIISFLYVYIIVFFSLFQIKCLMVLLIMFVVEINSTTNIIYRLFFLGF